MFFATFLNAFLIALLKLQCSFAKPNSKKEGVSQELKVIPRLSAPEIYRRTIAHYRKQTLSTRNIGTQPLTPYTSDSQYLVEAEIGTPPQNVSLVLDTGSSDLWVFSPQVPVWQQAGHAQYDPQLSSTAVSLPNETWAVRYGDGSTSNGNVFIDRVKIGGLVAENQAVETAKNVSIEFFGNPRADGIIGFGFSSRNKVKPAHQNVWFDNVNASLDSNLFALDLCHSAPSAIDFGFIDERKYRGDIFYTPVSITHQGAWGFNGTGFAFGNSTFMNMSIDGIADSGTSLMIIDDMILNNFYGGITGAVFNQTELLWIFPCNTTLPDLSVGIGAYRACVPAAYLNFALTEYAPSMCYGSLQSNAGLNLSIYGDVFLKSQFVVYDRGNMRLGFAPKTLVL